MKKFLLDRVHIILALFLIGVYIFSFYSVSQFKDQKKIQSVEENLNHIVSSYGSTVKKYELLTNTLYRTDILNDDVKKILLSIPNDKNKARSDLYDALKPTYEELKKQNFVKLHFHLKNNESFLRFDDPSNYGDGLSALRTDVVYVNETKKPLVNFNIGVNVYSLRFLFPIIINKEHIGSVEYGIAIDAFLEDFNSNTKDELYFFVNHDSLFKMKREESKDLYYKTVLDNYYIYGYRKDFNLFQKKLPKYEKTFFDKLNKKESFYLIADNYNLSVIPVENKIDEKIEAFFLNIHKNDKLEEIDTNFAMLIAFISIVTVLLLISLAIDKKVKTKIKNNSKNLQSVLNNQKALVALTNGKTLLHANKRLFDFFGFKNLEEFNKVHTCVCDFFEAEDGKNYIQKIFKGSVWYDYILKNKNIQHLVKMKNKQGQHHIFEISLNNYEDKYIVNFYDITKQKELEEKLYNLNKNLENLVLEEVAKNHQKDLLIQQQQRAVQMVELIRMIAHQWRQPLASIATVIVGLKLKLELGTYDLHSEQGQESFIKYLNEEYDDIENLIQKLTVTIDEFRNFYKITDKKTNTYISEIIEDCLSLASSKQEEVKVETIVQVNYKKPIELFKNEITQVILGILENAFDAFKANQIPNPKIIILVYSLNDKLYIEIEDNAKGINNEILDKIFDPYFSTKNEKNGMGLSLNMAKIIVEKHHEGSIIAKNINQGARFTITLPLS